MFPRLRLNPHLLMPGFVIKRITETHFSFGTEGRVGEMFRALVKPAISARRPESNFLQKSSHDAPHPELPRLLPRPFRRGEGWGEGLFRVVAILRSYQ